jgi:hypothetical protein
MLITARCLLFIILLSYIWAAVSYKEGKEIIVQEKRRITLTFSVDTFDEMIHQIVANHLV